MAEQLAEERTEAAKSGSMTGKLLVAGVLAAVIAVECLLAYLFIPSAEEVAAMAEQNIVKKLPATLASDEVNSEIQDEKAIEIDLGEYSITVNHANSHLALRVDFHLVGVVLEEDEKEIQPLIERNMHRLRDQILFEIRNSELEDLADPGLALIKRRILEKSNALFGKPVLRSIVFSQFSYIEQ